MQLLFSMLFVTTLYLEVKIGPSVSISIVSLCDAPARSQSIIMMILSVAMATCLHSRAGHNKLRMGPLERSLVARVKAFI